MESGVFRIKMNVIYNIFVYSVWFLSVYFVVLFLLLLNDNEENLFKSPKIKNKNLPKMTIIVSAFNEEKNISHTIHSLQKILYPKDKLELIVINDGSTDKTSEIIKSFSVPNLIFIDNDMNKGKAACLNQGIRAATGEFVATIDADSTVSPSILKRVVPYFEDEKTGAVTVSVYVKEPKTFLEKIIELEYFIGLSLFLKVLSYANCIHVTPGPFSIYRKDMLVEIGGYDEKNITEDLEIAYRIRKAGYKIDCCMNTYVKTKIPENFKGLYKQRKRWYTGAIHSFIKHKDMFMNKKYGLFGYFMTMNYALTFLGMILFVITGYLWLKDMIKKFIFFNLTNFNFLDHLLRIKEIDILSLSIFHYFGITAFLIGLFMMIREVKVQNKSLKKRKLASFGYLYIFSMYSIFWIVSVFNVILGRKVKWR